MHVRMYLPVQTQAHTRKHVIMSTTTAGLTTPFDVVKSRMMVGSVSACSSSSPPPPPPLPPPTCNPPVLLASPPPCPPPPLRACFCAQTRLCDLLGQLPCVRFAGLLLYRFFKSHMFSFVCLSDPSSYRTHGRCAHSRSRARARTHHTPR